MKKYFLAAFVLTGFITNAQIKQGTIIYERKVDVHRRLEDEQVKAMVPQFQTAKAELIFKDNVSLYRPVPEDNAPDPFDNGGGNGGVVIRIGGPGAGSEMYKDYTTQKTFEQTELADKDYIIDDTLRTYAWKLSDETKTILNHPCKKATMKTERGEDVIAWYAQDIQTPAGPDNFGGLPGSILWMDINNAERVYSALEIKSEAGNISTPTKGKHITRADFNKKLDELFGPATPDGRRMMIRN